MLPGPSGGKISYESKYDCGLYHSDNERSEYEKETKPDAFDIAGPQAENYPIDEHQVTVDGSNLVDDTPMTGQVPVEGKLGPELIAAEQIKIQEEEMNVKKKQIQWPDHHW